MSRRAESLGYILVHNAPWWVSVIIAGAAYVLLDKAAPHLMQDNKVMAPIMQAAPSVAGLAALLFLILAGLSLLMRFFHVIKARGNSKASGQSHKGRAVAKVPTCPSCHASMVMRQSKDGPYTGKQFWSCSHFPGGKGIRSL